MKSAKEIAEKYYNEAIEWGGRRSDHISNMQDAMKEYAREACKEQREICEKAWLDENVINSSNHVKMMAIRNAPEPNLK